MDWGYLFTSFEGRINRKAYWLAILVIVVVSFVVFFIAGMIFGAGAGTQLVLQIVFLLIFAYPSTALMVKRLHDRNRPGIVAAIFWAPTVLVLLGQVTGISGDMTDVYGTAVFVPNTIGWVLTGLSLVVGIWALIELGFLRGTDGPNDYGPDPLLKA